MKKSRFLFLLLIISLIIIIFSCDITLITKKDNSPGSSSNYLEPASNLNYCTGTFGDPVQHLKKPNGDFIIAGLDFAYDQTLLNIYDHNNKGGFDPGRYFRIIENGLNVSNSLGYNLEPYAINLSSSTMNPSSKNVYIDPVNGKFILPRPSYWNRCESTDCLSNPDILNSNETPSNDPLKSNGLEQITGKFNNAIRKTSTNSYDSGDHMVWYFRGSSFDTPNKGTFSFWIKSESGYDIDTYLITKYFAVEFLSWGGNLRFRTHLDWVIEDEQTWTKDNWNHLYVIWDTTKEDITDGKSLVVYLNGVEKYSTESDLTIITDPYLKIVSWDGVDDKNTSCIIDNIQMWDNEIVSQTPDWLYNSGTGIEAAMHYMYGPSNGYNPVDVQLGYIK